MGANGADDNYANDGREKQNVACVLLTRILLLYGRRQSCASRSSQRQPPSVGSTYIHSIYVQKDGAGRSSVSHPQLEVHSRSVAYDAAGRHCTEGHGGVGSEQTREVIR